MEFVLYQQPSCPFCKHFERMFKKYVPEGRSVIIPDHGSSLWTQHRIDFVPTVIAYKDGVEVARLGAVRLVGIRKEMWVEWLKKIGSDHGEDVLNS